MEFISTPPPDYSHHTDHFNKNLNIILFPKSNTTIQSHRIPGRPLRRGAHISPAAKLATSFEPVDREKTCPLLLRVFTKVGGHLTDGDFAVRGKEAKDEVQIYDATLHKLTDLVKEAAPEARRRDDVLSFALVYPDKHGGKNLSDLNGRGPDSGSKALSELSFQIGDYLDVAILSQ
ncbi:histone deacetylase complex subunit SAP18-like [Forsythia ovata]|uniref:Histone deacetylase complex subunit SAP18-like n=1 Tax=Forsythia ovata TaxID=205694 RepID=A0ABD1QRR9_9LAMI